MKLIYLKIAGIINAAVALLHLIAGQKDNVIPLTESNLTTQLKAEWISFWHMISVVLVMSSIFLLRISFGKPSIKHLSLVKAIGYLYLCLGIPAIASSIFYGVLVPQWILLMPIGALIIFSIYKVKEA